LYCVAALEPKFWRTLCAALDRPDLFDSQYSEGLDTQRELESIFASRTRDEWEQKLSGLEVCCEPVLDVDEVASHPQVVARRIIERGREGRAPALGEHTRQILAEVGLEVS